MKRTRAPRDSRARILAAATQEFARHGFAGAGVDRIARRARVNKAMIYYHFESKAELYREILGALFVEALERVSRIADDSAPSGAKLDRFVEALAETLHARPHFPAIWLREMADGGRHLDTETFATIAGIPEALGRILRQGRAEGAFGDVHPLLLHFTIIGPLMVHLASTPVRSRLGGPAGLPDIDPALLLRHVQRVARAAAACEGAAADALPPGAAS